MKMVQISAYVDGIVVISRNADELRQMMVTMDLSFKERGLKINDTKTK